VNLRRVIRKTFKTNRPGVDAAADVHAVIAANVNEGRQRTRVSSKQRIVQRNGKTEVFTEETEVGDDDR
jgi:hypothetical protein